MAIPSSDRNEYPVSSLGTETQPQGVLVKGSLWSLQLSYYRFILREYLGFLATIPDIAAKRYRLTPALQANLTVDSDRLWIWAIGLDDSLNLYEFEPFTTAAPVLTYSKTGLDSNVKEIDAYVQANDGIRVITLYNTDELKAVVYNNIRLPDPPTVSDLEWSGTRLDQIGSFVLEDKSRLTINYLDVASPPNVYVESYLIVFPTNFSAFQVGSTNVASLSWDAAVDADEYLIERDTDPAFTSPTSIYTSNLVYSDSLPVVGTYYYRLSSLNNDLLLQSAWTSSETVTLTLVAEFSGTPLLVLEGGSVVFTDESTPTGAITSWDWDFGDGSIHSTDQNPSHEYSTSGTYTVTLVVDSGLATEHREREYYITVTPAMSADFIGDPLFGPANLMVQFTDLTTGSPISWEWDFGDGSPHSFVEDPLHVYTIAGTHTVSLTVSDGVLIGYAYGTETVNMVADFIANNNMGPANLTVEFADITLGEPTSWEWDFGDGNYSTEQNPTHIYTDSGYFTVTLKAYRGIGAGPETDTETKTDAVTVYTHADFSADPRVGYQTLSVQFLDLSTGEPTSWYWRFGDGSYSTEQNPFHEYTFPGEYTVTLTATSLFNSDTETKTAYIVVSGTATPDIAPEPDILLYLSGQTQAYKDLKGMRVTYRKKE